MPIDSVGMRPTPVRPPEGHIYVGPRRRLSTRISVPPQRSPARGSTFQRTARSPWPGQCGVCLRRKMRCREPGSSSPTARAADRVDPLDAASRRSTPPAGPARPASASSATAPLAGWLACTPGLADQSHEPLRDAPPTACGRAAAPLVDRRMAVEPYARPCRTMLASALLAERGCPQWRSVKTLS